MKYKNQTREEPPRYLTESINDSGRALMIPHNINGTITQAVIRSLKEKRFLTINSSVPTPFGVGTLPRNRVFREPIVVVEGVADMYALRRVEPSVVCTLTAALSSAQAAILEQLTNTVILAYDNDETGARSTKRDTRTLKSKGLNVLTLKHPKGHKDPGEMLDLLLKGDRFELSLMESTYRQALRPMKENVL